jgi:uncharacterized protein
MTEPDFKQTGVVHIDWPSTDLERTAAFFKEVFDWDCVRRGDALFCSNPSNHVGVFHLVAEMPTESPFPVPYVSVHSIDEALILALSRHGTVVEDKQPLEGMGWRAVFADPDGNRFGIVERREE